MRQLNLGRVLCRLRKSSSMHLLAARRLYSKDAASWVCPTYDPEPKSVAKDEKDPCDLDQQKCRFKSMWEDPACCKTDCPDLVPRFDDLYYQPSDKRTRRYTQTWAECPQLKICPKKICCFDNIIYPKLEKRKRKPEIRSACPQQPDKKLKLMCQYGFNQKCQRAVMPGCKGSRLPPKCFLIKLPSLCKKKCAPYPSYSECMAPKAKPLHDRECECLKLAPCVRM